MNFDPFSYAVQEDPYPIYQWLRDEAPVWRNDDIGFWTLARYDDVLSASVDTKRFSSANGTTLEFDMQQPMLINMDPPEHTLMRKLVSRSFTPARVAALENYIRQLTRSYLEPLNATGHLDVVGDVSARVPIQVIGELLGLPEEHREGVRLASERLLHRDPDQRAMDEDNYAAAAELAELFAVEIERRRVSPGDDMITALIEATIDDNGEAASLTDEQLIGFCILLGVAGNETVTKLIANAVIAFDRHPEERRRVLEDSSLAGNAVDETLRWDGPSQYQGRTLLADVTLHGVTIPAGDFVLLLTGSANRDERQYEAPDEFRVQRKISRPLGFGHGAHVCLGAALARMETRIAIEELLLVAPDFVVDSQGVERMHSSNVRGLAKVPIDFTPQRERSVAG